MNGEEHLPGGRRHCPIVPRLIVLILLLAPGLLPAGDALTMRRVAAGFSSPVGVVFAPGDDDRLFVIEQHTGRILIHRRSSGTTLPMPFLDIGAKLSSDGEMGLLGLAFHPGYARNGFFYLNYTAPGGGPAGHTRIERYRVSADADVADAASASLVLAFDQPESNHNGGWIGFGPRDGLLYIASGDGGGGGDRHGAIGNAQDRGNLLGKILRIDVDGAAPYAIPASNPYAASTVFRREIWAFGLRNPWRCSFDRVSGDLWIGDVGQGRREEIDRIPSGMGGANLGWRPKEGSIDYTGETPVIPPMAPVYDYRHDTRGYCVIGGHVYRGTALDGWNGTYFFADLAGWIDSMASDAPQVPTDDATRHPELSSVGHRISPSSFGESDAGELFIADLSGGAVFTIVPALSTASAALPPASEGTAYSHMVAVRGAVGAVQWTQPTEVPNGLELSSDGVLSGIPIDPGTTTFTALLADATGARGTARMTITVVASGVAIATASPLPEWTQDKAMAPLACSANGGLGPYQWSVVGGALPAGLTLSGDGVLSGVPRSAGSHAFTLRAGDARGAGAVKPMAMTINPPLTTGSFDLRMNAGEAFSTTLSAYGGTGAKTWVITSGSLPAGLTLSTAGIVSGMPLVAGTSEIGVQVGDALGDIAIGSVTVTVTGHPRITSTPPTTATIGMPYAYDVEAAGFPPLSYSLGAAAPTGMAIDSVSGVIAWTPLVTGSFSVHVEVDSPMGGDIQIFSITVSDHALRVRPAATPYLGMPASGSSPLPATLSATGAFADVATLTPATALIPYDVNSPLWSDGAAKSRWIAVPDAARIAFAATGAWTFPAGTVFVKHFDLAVDERDPAIRRRLETRLLVRDAAGGVYGATYRWRAPTASGPVDADLVTVAASEDIPIATAGGWRTQTWTYPGREDCRSCHTAAAGGVLGVNTRQLNRVHAYANGISEQQIGAWNHIGLFSPAVDPAAIAGLPRLVALDDGNSPLEARVRSYLDANCAQCHRPGGVNGFDARWDAPPANRRLVDGLVANSLGIEGARLIAPRDRWRSLMHVRMESDDPARRMPPLARNVVDAAAVDVLRAWIDGLPGTPAMAPPRIAPAGGVYAAAVTVTLSHDDPAADVRYTTDGTAPTAASALYRHAAPPLIAASATVKARAFRSGHVPSVGAASTYTIGDPGGGGSPPASGGGGSGGGCGAGSGLAALLAAALFLLRRLRAAWW